MWSEKVCGSIDPRGAIRYDVTVDGVVLLAGKAGVGINHAIALEWLRSKEAREGIEGAINSFIKDSMLRL